MVSSGNLIYLWSSNVVLVRKKDGHLRIWVDYRQLTLDMKSGFHNIAIAEEHKERTAFTVGPLGFFEYDRMPFGLCNRSCNVPKVDGRMFWGITFEDLSFLSWWHNHIFSVSMNILIDLHRSSKGSGSLDRSWHLVDVLSSKKGLNFWAMFFIQWYRGWPR